MLLTELEKEQAVRDVRELIISSGITASVLRIVPGENLYGSDDQEYAQIATIPVEIVHTPLEDLAGKIDATVSVLPEADVLPDDRLQIETVTYRIQTLEEEHFFGATTHNLSNWSKSMVVKRTGDWNKAKAKLNGTLGPRIAMALQQATIRNALFLVREIQRGIRNQAPGGQSFAKLADSTIARKGSSKALIDTGFLINSITQKIMADKAFVGLLRGTVNKDGENMVNIGAVMEYGATINHPNGATIIILPRPFLHPVMQKYRKDIEKNYRHALKGIL